MAGNDETQEFSPYKTLAKGASAVAHELLPGLSNVTGEGEPEAQAAGEAEWVPVEGFEDISIDPNVTDAEAFHAQIPEEAKKSPELTGAPPASRAPRWVDASETALSAQGGLSGAGGLSGSISGTVGPEVPGELTAAQMAWMGRRADVERLGLQARADALGLAVDVYQENQDAWESNYETTKKQIGGLLDEAEAEAQAIGDLIDASKSDQINPGQFFANVGGAGRFASAIAVGAGAMATAFGGGPNAAYDIISHAIDRNVRAQLANQQHNRALIAHQANFVNTIRGLANDKMQYGNYLRIGLTAMAQTRLQTISAGLGQTHALLAAQDVNNRLGAALVDAQIRAITASRQKVTFKFKSLSQYSQSLRVLSGQSAGSPLAARRGGGGKAAPETNISMAGNTPEERAASISDSFQRMNEQGVPEAKLKQLQDEMVSKLDPGTSAALRALGRDSLLSQRETATEKVAVGTKLKAARPGERFANMTPEQQSKASSQVSSAATSLDMVEWLADVMLITNMPSKSRMLQHLRRFGDDWTLIPTRDPAAAALANKLDTALVVIQEAMRKGDKTRNAINTGAEMIRARTRAGQDISIAEHLVDVVWDNPELRKARIDGVVPFFETNLKAAESSSDLYLVPNE